MKTTIQRIFLPLILLIFTLADVQAGKWLSCDPIQDGAGFVKRDPTGPVIEPNLYAFVGNNPVNAIDPLGLVTVVFYGADTPVTFPNPGNQEMYAIYQQLQEPKRIFHSLSLGLAYGYVREQMALNPCQDIKILGHSWGGITAVKLARAIQSTSSRFPKTDIKILAVIDPVSTLRLPPVTVPSNVQYFWNRYQTAGTGVYIPVFGVVHGRALPSQAQSTDQVNLNPSDPQGLDHWTIIFAVRDQVIQLLTQ